MNELDQIEQFLNDLLMTHEYDENDLQNCIFAVGQLRQKEKFSKIKRESFSNPSNLRIVSFEGE